MLTISPFTFALVLIVAWVVLVFGTGGRRNAHEENRPKLLRDYLK